MKYKLGELLEKVIDNRGKTPPLTDSGYEIIETVAINGGNKHPDFSKISKFVSKEVYDSWFRKGHPKKDDILISTVGDIGKVAILNEDRGCIAQNLVALRTKKDLIDPNYLYYFLIKKETQDELKSLNIGSVQPNLKVPHLLDIEIDVPKLEKQMIISEQLSSIDSKIILNTQTTQTLEQIAQGIFKSWFIDFDPVYAKAEGGNLAAMQTISGKTADELAQLKTENPKQYQQLWDIAEAFPSEIGEERVPVGWNEVFLKDVCNIVYGKNLPTTKLEENGYPVFGGNGVIGFYSKFLYEEPQTLVSCRGAASGKVLYSLPNSFVTNNSLVIEHKKSYLSSFFVYESLRLKNLTELTSGSAQPQLTIANMNPVKIILPSEEIHKIYAKTVGNIYRKTYDYILENVFLSETRDNLLPKLLNGEI